MSIIVGRIENKFWNNSEYKFPNGFPVYEEQEELKEVEPNMNSFATGTVYLFGDNWNHCIYNGAYYSLYIQEVIDEERKFYTYRLERDFWFDVLRLRPEVVGDLVTSNNDELLEKNLNRTVAAIDNPARVITINFGEVEFDWRKNIDFKLAEIPIVQKVLSVKEFNRFIDSADCAFASKWKQIDKAFYSQNKNPAVFILDILKPSLLLTGWKNTLRNRVNEFVKNIHQTPKTELKLAKLTLTGRNAASPLNGKYCITQKVEGIATGEESDSYKIKQIDLSGLKDIVPINLHDLEEVIPTTNLLRGTKSGLFSNVETQASGKFFAKIKRKAYVPICATPDRRPEELGFGFNGNWNNVKNPQSIFWEYGGSRREEFLWWVDNLNFAIQKTGFGLYTEEVGREPPRKVSHYWYGKMFPFPIPWTVPSYEQGYEIFPELGNRELVPFGFLIYGIHRDFNIWFLFEYTGTRKLKEIEYINGIRSDFIENYRDENSWWSNLGSSFSGIRKSPEFLRFYLDVYNFGIMALLPGTYYETSGLAIRYNYPSYLYTDIWGTYELSNYKYYVPRLLTSGIYKNGELIEESLYSKVRFSEFLTQRQDKFRRFFNFGGLELPDGFEIAEGDYFFSDLDYEIETRFVWEKGKEKGKDWVSLWERERRDPIALYLRGKIAWEFSHQLRLEDFVKNEEGAGILKVSEGEELFVLCTTLKGNLDVRKIQGFSRTLSISKDPSEIVKEVEGSTQQRVHFSLLKKMSDPLVPEHGEFKITDRLKGKIIKGFYEAHGYKVIGEGEVFWNWYEEDDFGESSQTQHLFDLVGTDWYLHIAKGKISLICKDERNLEGTEKTLNSLLYHENKDLNLSLTEKINQKTRLQFFTAPYYLNWKTTFTDQDRIFLYSSLIKPTTQQTEFEQYFLRLETQFDRIWYENISIPKRVNKALELADSVRVQSLHMQLIRDQYQYQIDQDRLDLATKRYEESIKRSTIELENQRSLSLISAATSLVTGGMSVGSLSRLYRPSKMRSRRNNSLPFYNVGPNQSFSMLMDDEVAGKDPALRALRTNPKYDVWWTKGGFPKNVNPWGIAAYGVNALVGAGKNLIADFAFRFPERERQIGVEKQLGAEELGLTSLNINTNHMDRQITAQQKLNREANIYNNPAISEREVLDQFRERKEWHGKKLKDIYLVVFVPTAEQLVALESFREEFGVMCDIPNITMNFYEGMEPDIIRYRNLDDKAIRGIENLIIREFFKSHLMAGIKIIKTERYTYKLLSADEYRQQVFRLNNDLNRKEEIITGLENRINKVENDCNSQKTELQKRIDSIENQLNNANTQLNQKTVDLAAKEKEFEEAKKKLEEEIKKHKIDREEAEQKWDDCKRDYLNEKTAKNTLAKEKEELTKQLAEYGEDKKRLEWNRKELAKKRKELEAMTKEKENVQAKVTTLEAEKAKLEEQKTALIKDYEQERDDKLSAINELRTCEGEKEKLNKRIEELESGPTPEGDEDRIIPELVKMIKRRNYFGYKYSPEEERILWGNATQEEKKDLITKYLEMLKKEYGEAAAIFGLPYPINYYLELIVRGKAISDGGLQDAISQIFPDIDESLFIGKWAKVRDSIVSERTQLTRFYLEKFKEEVELRDEKWELEKQKADLERRLKELLDSKPEDYKKQKELLETQKADIERQLRESLAAKTELEKQKADIQKKFEDCKKNRKQQKEQLEGRIKELQKKIEDSAAAAVPAAPSPEPAELCVLFKKFLASPYTIDLKKRSNQAGEDTGNALRDLVLEIIKETSWMRKSGLDAKLSSRYPAMRPIFETLMKFEEIPLVSQWENAMDSDGWHEYLKIEELKANNKQIPALSDKVKQTKRMVDLITGNAATGIPTMETPATAIGIKAVLDELNWLTYKLKDQLKEQIKTDQDLIYFFAHIYPGESLNLYIELFGDPNTSIAKRRFIEDITCGTATTAPSTALLNYDKTTKYLVGDLMRQEDRKPKAPIVPVYVRSYGSVVLTGNVSDIHASFFPLYPAEISEYSFPTLMSYEIERSRIVCNYEHDFIQGKLFSNIKGRFSDNKEYGIYIHVDEKDIWNKIMGQRIFLWKNRSKIKIPEGKNFYKKTIAINTLSPEEGEITATPGIRMEDLEETVDLREIFGEEKAKDAAILLGIMASNFIEIYGFPDGYGEHRSIWVRVLKRTTNIMAAHRNLRELTREIYTDSDEHSLNVHIWYQFHDIPSLLNYVWRHIKDDSIKTLEDPLGPTYSGSGGAKFQEFLNKIWEANQ